jgi:hypothetical protein
MIAFSIEERPAMKPIVCAIASVLCLTACNKGPDINVKNASVGEVAQKVREASAGGSFVSPGKWQTSVSVLDIDMPGMPPQMQRQMKQSMASMKEHRFESCLTEADVKRPKEDFFAGKNNECRYDHFTMSGGKIDAAMRCDGKPSGAMTMTINGTYSRDSWEATTAMEMSGPEGAMKMRSKSESHRVGECTAAELKEWADAGK